MRRLRLLFASLATAVVVTLASSAVPGTHMMDCERDDPAPCVQVAGGFPFVYIVDREGISVANHVDLLAALIGEDLFLARHFWADGLIWWIAALAVWIALIRPAQPVRTKVE